MMIIPEHQPSSGTEKGMKVNFNENTPLNHFLSKDFLDYFIGAKSFTRNIIRHLGLWFLASAHLLSLTIVIALFEWKTYDNL